MSATRDLRTLHGMREFGSEKAVPKAVSDGASVIVRHNYSGTFSVLDARTRGMLAVFGTYPAAWRDADDRAHAR
jgi:hypothetical protein